MQFRYKRQDHAFSTLLLVSRKTLENKFFKQKSWLIIALIQISSSKLEDPEAATGGFHKKGVL